MITNRFTRESERRPKLSEMGNGPTRYYDSEQGWAECQYSIDDCLELIREHSEFKILSDATAPAGVRTVIAQWTFGSMFVIVGAG